MLQVDRDAEHVADTRVRGRLHEPGEISSIAAEIDPVEMAMRIDEHPLTYMV
jgi:hypothetical protein